MARVTGIGGVSLRARDPEALKRWYAEALDLEATEWGALFRAEAGDVTVWAAFEAATEYFGRRDQQAMVNYRVDDLDAVVERLRARGTTLDERRADDENGRFAWAVDPEGNRFELWEPTR